MSTIVDENAVQKDKKLHVDDDNNSNKEQNELSTKEAYFKALNVWVKQANLSQNAMAMFPWYLMSSYPQLFQQQQQNRHTWPYNAHNNNNINLNVPPNLVNSVGVNVAAGVNRRVLLLRMLNDQEQLAYIRHNGGYEYVIAPFWKRAAAELIDMMILLLLKILITFVLVNYFEFDWGLEMDKESLQKMIEDDTGNFFAMSFDFFVFSTDLMLLEVMTKLLVCIYEASCTAYFEGATLGKALIGLRIKHIEALLPLPPAAVPIQPHLQGLQFGFQPQRQPLNALLFPAETPSFQRAFVRALAKNMIMTLLFPMCFMLMFYKHNRTVYDMLTKTVVVEHNPRPLLRHP